MKKDDKINELDNTDIDNIKLDGIEINKLVDEYNNQSIPKNGLEEMQNSIKKAKAYKRRHRRFKNTGLSIAATVAIFVMLANSNEGIARAMERFPIIGKTVNVVTFGRFQFEDENTHANVQTPQIQGEEGKDLTRGEKSTNEQIKEYTAMLVNKFEEDIESNTGKRGLDVKYDIVTDNDNWFTLSLNVFETEASGYEHAKYYSIDKHTGEIAKLKDIFKKDSNYMDIISENIKTQMREQMKKDSNSSYFIDDKEIPKEDNFSSIKEDQNYYINNKNELVIVFDEYEVAPGYMGSPQFVISNDVIKDIRK